MLLLSCSSQEIGLPDLKLESTSGERVSLRSLLGKPVLLYIWSGTCVGHTKDLKRLAKMNLQGVEVVSVAIGMEKKDVEGTYSQIGISSPNFRTLLDKKIEISDYITLVFLPYTLIYDERGRLTKRLAKLPDEETLRKLLASH